MTTPARRHVRIETDPDVPAILIVREFDAPPDRVRRAWTDPALAVRWQGPKHVTTQVDPGPGPAPTGDGGRPAARLAQTYTYEAAPDATCLETVAFEALGPRRTRVTSLSVIDTLDHRDQLTTRGLERWVTESYAALDVLLAED
ncbi:SRPBCC family protein [Actinocorallia populi]|uniref:polyketide cyclase n=1 Tax=Actinocorallia populi TaxID=2079200 RepID=UPI000D097CE7|nr:polyketide cyclase [Actinocorallia populi]